MSARIRHLIFFALMSLSIWHLFQGGYIHAKAWLAQQLIQSAWHDTMENEKSIQPWPGADTYPVARLTAQKGSVDLVVLSGTSDRTLAFGPGHMPGTAQPGRPGNVVLSGHRDTHFAFLRNLNIGDQITLQNQAGIANSYEVTTTEVVHKSHIEVAQDAGDDRITLITCYPFDAIVPGGPLRYVVMARAVPAGSLEI